MVMRHKRLAGSLVLAALGLGGCGIDVSIMGGEEANSGQPVMYQIKLTNFSACPLSTSGSVDFVFMPLIPQSSPDVPEMCQMINGTELSPNLLEPGSMQREAAQAILVSVAQAGVSAECSAMGATCSSAGGQVSCDLSGVFMPGEMRTISCEALAGPPGAYFNIAASSLDADGVCKAGMNAGAPCSEDDDCGGVVGSCGSGICEDGTNDGNGCSTSMECPMGTCTPCFLSEGAGGDCSETLVLAATRPAPVLSPLGLLAIGGALCGVAALRLRRLRRDSDA
jgi:hypothetical protein